MAIAKSPTIDAWTTYYKSRSAYGILKIAKSRFPEIVALKENGIQPKRNRYEHLCKFVDKCQDALSLGEMQMQQLATMKSKRHWKKINKLKKV